MRLTDIDDLIEKANKFYGGVHDAVLFKQFVENNAKIIDAAPVHYAHWEDESGTCSYCKRSLSELMDSDSYFAIGLNIKQLVACPWCGAILKGGD